MKDPRCRIKGESLPEGKDLRQGIITDTDGTETLVVYTRLSANTATTFRMD